MLHYYYIFNIYGFNEIKQISDAGGLVILELSEIHILFVANKLKLLFKKYSTGSIEMSLYFIFQELHFILSLKLLNSKGSHVENQIHHFL